MVRVVIERVRMIHCVCVIFTYSLVSLSLVPIPSSARALEGLGTRLGKPAVQIASAPVCNDANAILTAGAQVFTVMVVTIDGITERK